MSSEGHGSPCVRGRLDTDGSSNIMQRFVALDSWRGIAALMVALFHLDLYDPHSHLHALPFLRNSYLFVDFFFVLSGFVIAASYQQRLLDGFGVGRFLWLRLGRLYPLHFVMLLASVGLKLLLILIPSLALSGQTVPFSAPQEEPDTIVANLLLIHSLHVYDFLTWNPQSWSISTEFYTYVLFVTCLVALRKNGWIALLMAMVAGPVLIAMLSERNMDTTYSWGIIRCAYGFAAGVVSWNLYRKYGDRLRKWLSGNIPELFAVALAVGFISMSGTTALSVAAPYVFGLMVLVFAFETGAGSAFLQWRPLVFLGTISYSVYMTHVFIMRRMFDVGRGLDNLWRTDFETHGASQWHADLVYLGCLALIIAASYFTYRWIERPAREWVRNRA